MSRAVLCSELTVEHQGKIRPDLCHPLGSQFDDTSNLSPGSVLIGGEDLTFKSEATRCQDCEK